MLGITFDTAEEATFFVEQYSDSRFDGLDEGEQAWVNEILVTVTGAGKIKATLNTERFLQDYDVDAVYHVGEASALGSGLEPGMVVGVTSVLEGDRVDLDSPAYPQMPLEPPSDLDDVGTLVSQDHVAENWKESYWSRIADMRDSTGYAIAYVAAQHGTSCHIIKGITNRADAEGTSVERRSVHEKIATVLRD